MEKRRKKLQGLVVSDRPQKSIVVEVSTKKKHPRYGKQIVWSKRYMVHDEKDQGKMGDTVEIVESHLRSRRKAFELSKVVIKAEKI